MKITLSRTQWEQIGEKAGWIKEAQVVSGDYTVKTFSCKAPGRYTYHIEKRGSGKTLCGLIGLGYTYGAPLEVTRINCDMCRNLYLDQVSV